MDLDPLIDFLNSSPTAWHAVENVSQLLMQHGFEPLDEGESWNIRPNGRYFVMRNGSALSAFVVPSGQCRAARILSSHTDSPALKLKPNAEYKKDHMVMFGVEVYGAPLLTSWLNRDLGLAGRVCYSNDCGEISQRLVNINHQPFVIPQLAIHLDRNVNENGVVLNRQEHLAVLAALSEETAEEFSLESILKEGKVNLLAHDLFFYPLEPARYIGNNKKMLAAYRIDSLCSVYAAVQALVESLDPEEERLKMIVFWDNEEVGSGSAQGAESPFLMHTLERITIALQMAKEEFFKLLHRSFCVSVDLGHALHPNHIEKHEPHHRPLLGRGVVLKINAQQRYASDAIGCALIVETCRKLHLPLQKFVARTDMPCGSTIGPINAAASGICTVDIGIPQLSMHSCREIISCLDQQQMVQLLTALL